MNRYNNNNLIRAIITGVAVGDALGFPVQFRPRSERQKCPVIGMGQYKGEQGQTLSFGDQLTGLWSDDASLTLCLAESLLGGFDLKDQAEKFVAWLNTGYMSARDSAFDEGIQTMNSLSQVQQILDTGNYEELEHLANNDDINSNGNGSLMRILPLVLYIQGKDPKKQFDLVYKAGAITHPHIRSALCCFYYLKMAEYIIGKEGKFKAYEMARKDTLLIMQHLACPDSEFKALYRLLEIDLSTLAEAEIDSGGYVVSSLEASIWCLLTTDTFSDAVLKAVNLGDDADTTGAITGGLAALLYGIEEIPIAWINLLKKPEIFEGIASRYKDLSESKL